MKQGSDIAPTSRSSRPRLVGALVSLGVVLLLLLPWIVRVDSNLQRTLLIAQVALIVAGTASSITPGFRPLQAFIFIFVGCWITVPTIYQISHSAVAWNDIFLLADTSRVTKSILITDIALASFSIGLLSRRHTARTHHRPDQTPSQRSHRLASTYIILSLLLLPYVVVSAGGVAALFSSRDELKEALASQGIGAADSGGAAVGFVRILPGALALAGTLLIVVYRSRTSAQAKDRPSDRRRTIWLFAGLVLVVLYLNPLANSRFTSVAAFGSLAVAYFVPRSGFAGKIAVSIGLVALLVVYPFANVFRAGVGDKYVERTGVAALAGPDYDGFQQIVNSEIYVDDEGYTAGQFTSSAALFFVPRSVWSGKAEPASIVIAEHRNYWFTNLSLPIFAEIYVDWSLVGMVIIGLLFGHLWRRLDDRWLRGGWPELTSMVAYLCMGELGLVRGPMGSLMPIYVTTSGLLAIAVVLSRRRSSGRAVPLTV